MGMGMMDALARAMSSSGGMGMMGQMQSPAGKTLVQALLAKHGAPMPTANAGDGIVAPHPGVIGKPDLGPTPVDLGPPPGTPVAPVAPPPGSAVSLPDNGALRAAADSTPTLTKPNGLFDRIGDFLHSDEGRAALLRSGAATLQGGLGAGIEAGANFVDQRRHERAAGAQAATENAFKEKQLSSNYNLGLGRLDVDQQSADEAGRSHRANEGIERSRIGADVYKHNNPSGDARLRVAEDRFQHITPSGDTTAAQGGENYRHDTASADNTQDNQTQIMRDRIAHAPTVSMHAHYTTTPEEYAKNGPRLRPSQVQPNPGGATQIGSDEEYNALPSGARFMGPDGQIRIKP